MNKHRYLAAARTELKEAVRWYAERGVPEAGLRLIERSERLAQQLSARFPQIEVPGTSAVVRRALVKGFPYQLVFVQREDENVIIAVVHGKRRPLYWAKRVT